MIFIKDVFEKVNLEEEKMQTAKIVQKITQHTHISLASFCGTSANSAKPEHMPQNAASDQVLHCLLTEVSFKI